jgi:hypothetical protein
MSPLTSFSSLATLSAAPPGTTCGEGGGPITGWGGNKKAHRPKASAIKATTKLNTPNRPDEPLDFGLGPVWGRWFFLGGGVWLKFVS